MHWFVGVLSIVVALVGPFGAAVPRVAAVQDSSPAVPAVELPATPVGEQLAWLIALLNGGTEQPTDEDVASHFTSAVLAELPPSVIIGVAQQFAEAFGPFTYQGPARPSTPNQVIGYLTGRDEVTFLVVVATEASALHPLTGAALLPVPPPSELPAVAPESLSGQFNVGGRELFLTCSGTGDPTVILEAGYGDSGGLWAPVQNGVAPRTRVCSYDRPNVSAGASDPAHTPRTAEDQVADLHALLTVANIPGPYVLAAHSYGGLITRLYAATYPDEVVGMVLVDTVHEDEAVRRQAMMSPEQWAALQDLESQGGDFERVDEEASWDQVREAQLASPMQAIPLVVLAAGHATDPSRLPPDWPIAEEEQLHRQLQVELAGLVPNGEYVLVEQSGHYIQLEQPDLVIDAIANVIENVRDPSRWGTPAAATPTSGVALTFGFDDVLQAGIDEGLTGVALVVHQDGQTFFAGVAGLANGEAQTLLAPTDRFRIYSITKTFTAVLVLQLVDEGVLTLDDTVSQWLDDPVVARIPNVNRITIRQLLTHTSGVYDYYNGADSSFVDDAITGEGADWSKVWTAQEVLAYADGARHAADFDPCQGVNYSDTGYILLGMIVEQASGQSFTEQLHARILDPLGLADTFFAAAETVPGGTVEGYHRLGDELINVSEINLSWAWTQGGMVSTTEDLARFADALFGGDLIEPASLEAMLTFLPADEQGREWGMGVARVQTPMGRLIGMNGSGPGFVARMYRLPIGASVVLLTNTNLEDGTVNAIFEQAVQVALGSVMAMTFPLTPGRDPEVTL